MQKTLEQRWHLLWGRLGRINDSSLIFAELIRRYSEPHRFYHTLAHIQYCLNEFDKVRDFATDPDAVEIAIWFHDVIYDTKAKDNEEQSAKFFREIGEMFLLPKVFVENVVKCILATKHNKILLTFDERLIADIDLSILGQSEDVFDASSEQIRKEYEWVPEEIFIKARLDILESFLKRPMIYSTRMFYKKYEQNAQQNLFRSQARLRYALSHQ